MIRWLSVGVIISMLFALCACITDEERAYINSQIAAAPPVERSSLASAVEEKIKDEMSTTASEINSLAESIASSLSSAADAVGEDALSGSSDSSAPVDIYPFEDDANIPEYDLEFPLTPYDIEGEGTTGEHGDTWEIPEFSTSSK